MRFEIEIRSFMSRRELDQALQISIEAATRLAGRMTPQDLQRIENYGEALVAVADTERRREKLTRRLTKPPMTIEGRAN